MSKKVRRQAIGVALFPFLAVLICTMGALIVLLVLLVQQASLDAREIVKDRARNNTPPVDPLAAERKVAQEKIDDEQWRRTILDQQRAGRAEELQDARLKVDHLADHIQRLQEQARSLIARAQEIDRGQAVKSPNVVADQAELARLQAEIARKKADLEAKKKDLAKKDRSYALIPYDGPNGTKRRPIYIECTQRGVILQPEGLILGPDDFSGPLNPGNPLDAALRAIRETWKKSGEPGEPYPLLVVRPDGIVAYQAARQALRGWDDEFGYELIDDEKKLDFGTPNPAMQRVLEQIVGTARQRQVMLAAAMPRKFQSDDTLTSFAPEDQPAFQEAMSAAQAAGGVANGNGEFSAGGAGRGNVGGGGYVVGNNGTGTGQGTGTNAQFAAARNNIQASRAGQGSAGTGYNGGTGSGTGPGGSNYPPGTVNSPGGNAAGGANAAASGNSAAGGNAAAAAQGNTNASGQPAGQPNSAQFGSGRPGSANSMNNQTAGAGQGSAGPQNGTSGSGGPNSSSGAPTGSPSNTKNQQARAAKASSNWGLPGAQGRTTAVTRPIRVVCLPDRLIVAPERGDDRAASVTPISPQLQPAEVEAFVASVQKHLNAWGPAMTNGYWKPVLQVEVSHASEAQFETLQQLLQGSGFDLQRKNP